MTDQPTKKYFISAVDIAIALAIAIFFAADRFLKAMALSPDGSIAQPLLGDFIIFRFTANQGIAFSLPIGGRWFTAFLVAIVAALISYVIYSWQRNHSKIELLSWTAVTAGAFSNLLDRLAHGFVVDYLEIRYFSVLNLADVLITLGVFMIILINFRKK